MMYYIIIYYTPLWAISRNYRTRMYMYIGMCIYGDSGYPIIIYYYYPRRRTDKVARDLCDRDLPATLATTAIL